MPTVLHHNNPTNRANRANHNPNPNPKLQPRPQDIKSDNSKRKAKDLAEALSWMPVQNGGSAKGVLRYMYLLELKQIIDTNKYLTRNVAMVAADQLKNNCVKGFR